MFLKFFSDNRKCLDLFINPNSVLTCYFFYNSATAPSVLGGIYFYENTLIYLQNPPNFRSTLHIHDVEVENVYNIYSQDMC